MTTFDSSQSPLDVAWKPGERSAAHSEAQLQRDRTFRQAIVNAPLPILIYAEDGEILALSEGWTRITGYSAEDIPTLDDWVQKAYGHQSADVLAHINTLFALDQTIEEGEFTLTTKSGLQRVWQFSSSPLGHLADGRRLVMSMAADITALKASEEKVEQLNQVLQAQMTQRTDQLLEANRELADFTYTVSHDLRAPLRAMEGFAKALLEDYAAQMDTVACDYAGRIVKAATKMDALVSDLLEYGQLSRRELSVQPLSIQPILAQVCEELAPAIADQKAQVVISRDLVDICGNDLVVRQIFTNLLANGIKFVAPHVCPTIAISCEETADRVRFWICDNGLGIHADHQQRIFSMFERLHNDDVYPGTGVGLAIVKRGAQKMGGDAGVISTLGQGSRFWVDFVRASRC